MDNALEGKLALVTGGTGGIGYATAVGLARMGAQTLMVGRSQQKGEQRAALIRAQTGNPHVTAFAADLASQQVIRRLAADVSQRYGALHILVNNVGAVYRTRRETIDGIEAMLAVNHLASFLLTQQLMPLLVQSAPARIVTVSGGIHRRGTIDFADLQARRHYDALRVLARWKLGNLLFSYELARRLASTGVTANAVNPGGARTEMADSPDAPWIARVTAPIAGLVSSPERAARPSIFAATAPELAGVSGAYIDPALRLARSSPMSYDRSLAARLWEASEALLR